MLQSSENEHTHAYDIPHCTLRAMHRHKHTHCFFMLLLPWKSATTILSTTLESAHTHSLTHSHTARDGCTLPFILCYNEIQFIVVFDFAYSRTYQTKEKQIKREEKTQNFARMHIAQIKSKENCTTTHRHCRRRRRRYNSAQYSTSKGLANKRTNEQTKK